ncbi:MAG: hypothetical protein U0939_02395 [Pirellulales bacterium]
MSFDAYYQWLGIPPREQPPNHYRLLGLELFESNPDVISHAADRQMVHLRSFQNSKQALLSQRLLNEVSAARLCLLDPQKRTAYDAQLREKLATAPPDGPTSAPSAAPPPTAPPVAPSIPPPPPAPPPVAAPVAAANSSPAAPPNAPRFASTTRSAAAVRSRTRRRRNMGVELLKIVLGGLLGCAIGLAVLLYGFRVDLFGLREKLPAEWLAAARVPPAAENPESDSRQESGADAANIEQAGSASSSGSGATSTSKPPDRNTAQAPPDGNPAAETNSQSLAGAPRNSDSSPRRPSSPNPPPSRPRVAPPPADAQAAARKVLETVHKPAQAKTRSEKRALAEKLLAASADPTASEVEQYVILRTAAELAEEAGAALVVLQVVERMDRLFVIDATSAREKLLIRTAQNVYDEPTLDDFVHASQTVVSELVRLNQLEAALRLTDAAYDACLKTQSKKQRKYVYDGRNVLRKLHQRWVESEEARKAIENGDNDPTHFETLGQFLCVYHDDWESGLVYLTRAPSGALRAAAEADLAKPSQLADRIHAGDLWYDLVKSNAAYDGFAERAIYWYELAAPDAKGLERAKATMRLDEMRTRLKDFDAREMSVGGLGRRL